MSLRIFCKTNVASYKLPPFQSQANPALRCVRRHDASYYSEFIESQLDLLGEIGRHELILR